MSSKLVAIHVLMGEYMRRMTGPHMLHVDQTVFFTPPDQTRESPMYATLVEKFPSTEPFVLRAAWQTSGAAWIQAASTCR